MSIRNNNSSKLKRRFQRRHFVKESSKPVDYTEMYKLHGIPVHNVEAVKQFNEKRENYQRLQALEKRKRMRENFTQKKKSGNKTEKDN